ncbi:MAG: type II secretion system protein [Dehalococcoidia bacterium]|nr:type II secretion system protein [Dehalococcoidia bacterium]
MIVKRPSRFVKKRRRTLPGRGQKGYVLIEVLVSIAIFGVISVGFLSALVAGYHGVIVAHDVTMAESLTRTTFENVRDAGYPVVSYQLTQSRYDIIVTAENISDLDTYAVVNGPSDFQKITVTIRDHGTGKIILDSWTTKVR